MCLKLSHPPAAMYTPFAAAYTVPARLSQVYFPGYIACICTSVTLYNLQALGVTDVKFQKFVDSSRFSGSQCEELFELLQAFIFHPQIAKEVIIVPSSRHLPDACMHSG